MTEPGETLPIPTESKELTLKEREISGVWEAIQLADRVAKDKKTPIDEKFVEGLHARALKHFPLSKPGQYRQRQVAISSAVFLPPEWNLVPREMQNYCHQQEARVSELDSSLGGIEKVVDTAAWAHFQISKIHPFEDGNGRVARLVADTICKRAGLYYITDWGADIDRYLDSLRRVDSTGDNSYFEEYVAERLVSRYSEVEAALIKSSVSNRAMESGVFVDLKNRRNELARIANSKGVHRPSFSQ